MPRISLYPVSDGRVFMLVDGSWSTVRVDENTSADGMSTITSSIAIGPAHTTGRGGGYTNVRGLFAFDLSSIPPGARVTSVKFFLDAVLTSTNKLVPVVSTNTDALAVADYGSVFPSIASYHAASAISTSGTTLTLNSRAIEEVQDNIADTDYFTIGVVGEKDFTNSTPASNTSYAVSVRMSETGGTSTDPRLTIDWEDNAVFFGANF